MNKHILENSRVSGPRHIAPYIGAMFEWWASRALKVPMYKELSLSACDVPATAIPDLATEDFSVIIEVKALRGRRSAFKLPVNQIGRYADMQQFECPFGMPRMDPYYMFIGYESPEKLTAKKKGGSVWECMSTAAQCTKWAVAVHVSLLDKYVIKSRKVLSNSNWVFHEQPMEYVAPCWGHLQRLAEGEDLFPGEGETIVDHLVSAPPEEVLSSLPWPRIPIRVIRPSGARLLGVNHE